MLHLGRPPQPKAEGNAPQQVIQHKRGQSRNCDGYEQVTREPGGIGNSFDDELGAEPNRGGEWTDHAGPQQTAAKETPDAAPTDVAAA